MSLIKCKECNKDFSSDAKSCPNCGSAKHRSFIKKHPIWSIIIALIALPTIASSLGVVDSEVSNNKTILPTQEIKEEIKPQKENWDYENAKDNMRGTTAKLAATQSINSIDLGFPYNDSKMSIMLRLKEKEEDVLLIVKGQFVCNEYREKCTVNVKFDDKEVEKYEFTDAAHATSDTIFIKNTDKFIKNIKASKHMIIEATLFDHGAQQYEFDIENLKW